MYMVNNKLKFISICRNDVVIFNMCYSIVIGRFIFKGERYKLELRYNMIVWVKLESLFLVYFNFLIGDVFNGDLINFVYVVFVFKLFIFLFNDR